MRRAAHLGATEYITIRLPLGHLLLMRIGESAGLAVAASAGRPAGSGFSDDPVRTSAACPRSRGSRRPAPNDRETAGADRPDEEADRGRYNWKVRPYVLTAGRTRTRQLLVHTLVRYRTTTGVRRGPRPGSAPSTSWRARRLLVAELSALCGVLARRDPGGPRRPGRRDAGAHPRGHCTAPSNDHRLLERLRDGLREFA